MKPFTTSKKVIIFLNIYVFEPESGKKLHDQIDIEKECLTCRQYFTYWRCHAVEATAKITSWRPLEMHFWNVKKTASLFFEHWIGFCKCLFYTLKLSLWNLHWYRRDTKDEACKQLGPVVSPCRFANLRNNGAGQLTIWILRNFSSILGQIITVFPKNFNISTHKKC